MPRTAPRLTTLILLAALSTLTLNMFLPSLGGIARAFEVDYALVSLAVGGYLAVTAVVQIIVGPLSDRFGRRPVLLAALLVFIAASIICALSQNIWVFLAARVLQSAMTAGYALSLAIVRDTTDPQKSASVIGTIATIMAIAPILGPALGGLLDTWFGWRASFVVYTGAGVALLLWCWFDLGETRTQSPDTPTPTFRTATGTLLRLPGFWAYALCTAFSTSAFFAFIAAIPFVAETVFGITTAQLGLYIGSITIGYMAGSWISSRLAARLPLSTMMLAGRSVACLGLTLGMILVAIGVLSPLTYFASTICVGLGNGLTMPSSNSGAMSVRPDLAGSAAGFSGALTVTTGAALTTLAGIVVPGPNAALTLLALMLAASAIGLAAAFGARRYERAANAGLTPG